MSEVREPNYPVPRIWNLAGLSPAELEEISVLIGGSAEKAIDDQESPSFERYDTLIMEWGDERLAASLELLADQAGYPYGAEQTRLVTFIDNLALLMYITPKLTLDSELYTDEKGEIYEHLLYLADPTQNPSNIFYSWDESGKQALGQDLRRNGPIQAWVELDKYFLAYTLGVQSK